MNIRVKFYASFREAVGSDSVELALATGATVGELVTHLQSGYPKLAGLENAIIAVNKMHRNSDWKLEEGDEVAIMPPVAGG